jgi:hypothetical protein
MDSAVLVGFLKVIAISLIPVVLFGAALHLRQFVERCRALGRRARVLPTPFPAPTGPPLEKLAADLRRLRPEVRSPRPGIAMARQRGIVAAYDSVLIRTAEALDVPTTLGELTDLDHEAERIRLEHALEQAGISWQVQEH